MTTKGTRREYSTNVVRVLESSRSPGSNHQVNVDNNLDYLLDDLQSSINRAEGSFGSNIGADSYRTKSSEVQYLSPANSTTVVRERSKSPGYDSSRIRKVESYQYSTSSIPKNVGQQNVSQLDTLLQDLQHEREFAGDRDNNLSLNFSTEKISPEPGAYTTRTTNVYSSTRNENKPIAQRELIFDAPTSDKSPTYSKIIETKTVRDTSFEPGRVSSPYTVQPEFSTKTVTLDTTQLPDDLKNVPLSEDILPVPGTKVTTTVRTYTYEIPAEPVGTNTRTLLRKNESYNINESSPYPQRDAPSTVVFKTESYKTDTTGQYPPQPREPSVSPIQTTTKSILSKRDTSTTTNYYPGQPDPYSTEPRYPAPHDNREKPPINTNVTYVQNITNTTNSVDPYPTGTWPNQPSGPQKLSPSSDYPPGGPGPARTYYYKHESSNTTNTLYGPPGSGRPSDNVDGPHPPHGHHLPIGNTPNANQPPHGQPHPQHPSVVSYNYSSQTTNTGYPPGSEREPLLQPAPFPTDEYPVQTRNGEQPPKRLDDLLASLDNGPGDRQIANEPYVPRKELETGVATGNLSDARIPSKNIAGPPVYYPPGQEMFARKEEGGAAWRAQGGYAKGSGRYEYEAESKSKSKSKSGAAVVPVCLPLCCAMPCSIM